MESLDDEGHYTQPPPRYPYCGRIDQHEPHGVCPGPPITEGAVPCSVCGEPTRNGGALCLPCAATEEQIYREMNEEWWL